MGRLQHGACLSPPPAELRLHRTPRPDDVVIGVSLDVASAHHGAVGDVVLQPDPVCQPNRQRTGGEARRGGHQFAPHGIAALAVQHFAGAKGALGDRHGVAAKAVWLAAQRPPTGS